MKRMKKCIIILGMFCLCALISACSGKNSDANLPVLMIGSDEYAPYNYLDDNGEHAGIDVEIAKEACRRMGYRPEFKMIKWDEKESYLRDRVVDCLWGCFSMQGRDDDYAWAGPYMYSRQVVAVRADSGIYSLADLSGKTVAVQSTSKPEGILLGGTDSRIKDIKNVYSFVEMDDVFAALRKGYVDACAGHETAILEYMKNSDGKYRILDNSLMSVGLGVAFYKDYDNEPVAKLNEVLQEMTDDGTMADILEKYGLDVKKNLRGGNS